MPMSFESSPLPVVVLFILQIVNRSRREGSRGMWLDGLLLGVRLCVVVIMVALGAIGFAGF
jgi:hypothetical protein